MVSRYRTGADAERKAVLQLKSEGWDIVIRSAGSKSAFDVVALRRSGVLALQVKHDKSGKRSHGEALANLSEAAHGLPGNARAELWISVPRQGFRRLRALGD